MKQLFTTAMYYKETIIECITTKILKKTNQLEIYTKNNTAVRSTKKKCWQHQQ